MLVLNFSHPLTDEQQEKIRELAKTHIDRFLDVHVQIDQEEPLESQIRDIVDKIGLSSEDWQRTSLLINPPGYAPAACMLMAELHGRIGHFPTLIRLRPRDEIVTTYEVAESLNLQSVRDSSRKHRTAL